MVFDLKGVGKTYGSGEAGRALGGVDLSIRKGERVALVGPSGAGKTTLLGVLNGRVAIDEGEVKALGSALKEGRSLQEKRCRMAWIPQDLGLVGNVRVIQNVVMGAAGRRGFVGAMRDFLFPAAEVRERVFEILKRVGIEEKIYQRTDTLSGGQRQRVAIARALYQEAEVILADEPVSAVDPGRARDLVGLLNQLSEEDGRTLVMSIHQVKLAEELFDRMVGLKAGEVVFDGRPSEGELGRLYELRAEVQSHGVQD